MNLSPYETDSSQLEGNTNKVFHPASISEAQSIVKKTAKLSIRGGGTGLAGGAVPQGEAILDLSKLDKILEFNESKKTVVVEAGVILDELQEFLAEYDLEFPINPSSHAICTIGGMISTNAVGSRAVKYGKTSDWVLWLDVITPSGSLERKNKSEIMDFAGMEGITGVIVKAGLRLKKRPFRTAELLTFESLGETIDKVRELKKISEISMIEYIDPIISEIIGLNKKPHLFVERETETKIAKESSEIYEIRDRIYPKLAEAGFSRIEDPKVMLDKIEPLIEWLEERKIPSYGHISVGLIHPCFSKEQESSIPEMMKIVKRMNGQISGEHGIGILKKRYLDPNDLKLLMNIKKRLDPKNKFNPGKII